MWFVLYLWAVGLIRVVLGPADLDGTAHTTLLALKTEPEPCDVLKETQTCCLELLLSSQPRCEEPVATPGPSDTEGMGQGAKLPAGGPEAAGDVITLPDFRQLSWNYMSHTRGSAAIISCWWNRLI